VHNKVEQNGLLHIIWLRKERNNEEENASGKRGILSRVGRQIELLFKAPRLESENRAEATTGFVKRTLENRINDSHALPQLNRHVEWFSPVRAPR
jgi:hypothetical protein